MPGSRSEGRPAKKASKAARPPAEAPIPTTGKLGTEAPEGFSGAVSLRGLLRLLFNGVMIVRAVRTYKGQMARGGR